MIIFDSRFGPFPVLAQHETVRHYFKVTREGPGEIILDLPFASITFTNHHRPAQA
ncbi:hypothetical protein MUY21_09785 [Aliiroseovarius sp. S2029]|uniref:hypothetical protein n=1 Tax=Aliiroseovarius sp. S2029 TaxID=2936988 RepID=UPI0020C1333E|nr:hypothetical protein [Aliiroseovarius sp. S2029]MCK8484326.1 hypothetical protein [Aliiroseovarius sp. S2029]